MDKFFDSKPADGHTEIWDHTLPIVAQQGTVEATKLSPLESIQVRLRVMRDEKHSSKSRKKNKKKMRLLTNAFAIIAELCGDWHSYKKNDEVCSSRRHTHFEDAEQMIDSFNGGLLL